jgi:glycerophosphoryl diester phosphodiesterase
MVMPPIVIGHRGASGYAPEHTLASYFLAMLDGADYIEPDLVMTRDGVLVARHENEIGATTDVAARAEFADRRATRSIDGATVEGWFTEDFSLEELKTLRARERIPQLRPANTRFDGQFEVPTLEEIIILVLGVEGQRATRARQLGAGIPKRIGIYPETKHPSYFASCNLAMEQPLVDTLARYGYQGRDAPIWLQSFEVHNLRALARMTQLPLVQLIEDEGAPFDLRVAGDTRTYRQLVNPRGLAEIASYAQAIGPNKSLIIPRGTNEELRSASSLVADAHVHGLKVHPWTFRAENAFLPQPLRSGGAPSERGDLKSELLAFLRCGIDGFFTDQPDIGVAVRDAFLAAA